MAGASMKYGLLIAVLTVWAWIAAPLNAQTDDFIGVVRVESAFARVLPDFEAEPSASVFDDERLEVVGRNLDGSWFEVRRVGRFNNLGWMFSGTLTWDFAPELLPLRDFTTGMRGPNPLMSAPLYAIYLNEAPNLRVQPLRRSPIVPNSIEIPPLVTIPVIARNQDGSWLFVNYLGYQGWIVAYAGRPIPNVLDILPAPDLPPLENVPRIVIPPEIQQAQIDRVRLFINERRALAVNLEGFWWRVFRGEVMPCDAPPDLAYYPYGDADVQQLPELQRFAPRLRDAIDYMMEARTPLLTCGVIAPGIVIDARDGAINARVIFDATLDALLDLERNIVQARR
jgi:hypothetical protein